MWSAALTSWLCFQFSILVSSEDYMIFNTSLVQQFTLPKKAWRCPGSQLQHTSFFGLSLSLRNTSILIGAPPGLVYKCGLGKTDNCECYPIDDTAKAANENKNNQQLGFTIAGASELHAAVIVCTPKYYSDTGRGVCYLVTSKEGKLKTERTFKLQPNKENRWPNDKCSFSRSRGLSARVVDQKVVLIGSPAGPAACKGFVEFYDPDRNMNTTHYDDEMGSSFGFAVESWDESSLLISAPSANNKFGFVKLYKRKLARIKKYELETLAKFAGQQMGEQFGYALLREQFGADGQMASSADILISAPLHQRLVSGEQGVVYVYPKGIPGKPVKLHTHYTGSGRFGLTMVKLGDINSDSYNDLAVAAPFEDDGVVYIFLGGSQGISTKWAQRLRKAASKGGEPSKWFGLALSRPIQRNKQTSFAIAAPKSDIVFMYQTHPASNMPRKQTNNSNYYSHGIAGNISAEILNESNSKRVVQYTVSLNKQLRAVLDIGINDEHVNFFSFPARCDPIEEEFYPWINCNLPFDRTKKYKLTINIILDLTNARKDTVKLSARLRLLNYIQIDNVGIEIKRKKGVKIRSDASSSSYQLQKGGRTINHTFNIDVTELAKDEKIYLITQDDFLKSRLIDVILKNSTLAETKGSYRNCGHSKIKASQYEDCALRRSVGAEQPVLYQKCEQKCTNWSITNPSDMNVTQIMILVSYALTEDKFKLILNSTHYLFVLQTFVVIPSVRATVQVDTLIYKYVNQYQSIYVNIIGTVVGLACVGLIILILWKIGFFDRTSMAECPNRHFQGRQSRDELILGEVDINQDVDIVVAERGHEYFGEQIRPQFLRELSEKISERQSSGE